MWDALRRAARAWPPRMLAEWAGVALLASAFVTLLCLTGASARLDNVAYDAALRLTARPTDPGVVIVAIDDRALADLGAWPWPRGVHAAILDRLAAAGARAVAYDVLFIEPTERGEDQALARALTASPRVCLPVLIEAPGRDGAAFRVVPPLPALARAAAGLGHVDLDYDPDGVSRRANLVERAGPRGIPQLMRCVQAVGAGRSARTELPQPRDGSLERAESVLIPYGGGPGRVRTVSAASLLRGEVPDAFFRGRYVIVGATAAGLHDRHSTPVSTRNEAMSGVEVQANLLEGLLSGRLIRAAAPWFQLLVSLGLVWSFLGALLVAPPGRNLLLAFGLVAAAVGLSVGGLLVLRSWLALSPAVLTLLLVTPLWGWRRLEAANAYMRRELERFAQEPDVLPAVDLPRVSGDPVERHMALMGHAVGRARDLRAAAALASRQREEVVTLLSHDIRAPQSAILALLATSESKSALTDKIAGYARRTLALASNFVHLAKVDSGVLTEELLDLAALTTEALDELWPVARQGGVRLEGQGDEEEYLIRGDRSLLTRAVVNLLDNAIKYSPPGGLVIAAITQVEGQARLSVTDQGPGLSSEQQARLFQRFERAGGAASGIGLGLILVEQVVRRHGGEVACLSRPGEGATFLLTLPLAEVADC